LLNDPYVSIVIATSSRYESLDKLLNCLRNQTYQNFEIILVCIKADEVIRRLSLKYNAKFLEDQGKGLCYARNLGIREAKGKIVIFLDDDVILDRDWVEIVVKNFNLNCRIAGVGGIPIPVKDNRTPHRVGIYDIISDITVKRTKRFVGWQSKTISYKAKVDFLSGSNMAFRRDILLQIGGFDENFYGPSVGEDVDVCLRILRSGTYYLILDPNAKVYHHSDCIRRWSTFHKNHPSFFFSLGDNLTYFCVKHKIATDFNLFPYLLLRFVNALFWMVKTRNLRVFFSYINGVFNGRTRANSLILKKLFGGEPL
jgi:GT2 family glycosyltransferase